MGYFKEEESTNKKCMLPIWQKKKKGKSEIFVLIITEKKILKKADALE